MAFFNPKTIQGVTYTLDHLDPFEFALDTGDETRRVAVRFRCHCFTEKLAAHHTPDFQYVHAGETRAFDFGRHGLSKLLPTIIRTLGTRSVYRSQARNYFILRQNPTTGFNGPYLIFFNVIKAHRNNLDVIMNVESAYMKPGMTDRASPIRFATLIEKTALNQPVPQTPWQTIKRK